MQRKEGGNMRRRTFTILYVLYGVVTEAFTEKILFE